MSAISTLIAPLLSVPDNLAPLARLHWSFSSILWGRSANNPSVYLQLPRVPGRLVGQTTFSGSRPGCWHNPTGRDRGIDLCLCRSCIAGSSSGSFRTFLTPWNVQFRPLPDQFLLPNPCLLKKWR